MKNVRFNKNYFAWAVLLFFVEVVIALFVHDKFIRPYVGDVLVVILIYCALKSVFAVSKLKTAVGVLLFAFAVETTQYLGLIFSLGWEHSALAGAILGTSFAWEDIWAYIIGFLIIVFAEKYLNAEHQNSQNSLVHDKKHN
ncbi:ribosomal maturation YjgA family protein [Flavobacterium aurantiibacter]|uniref:DUF2809 domain-containing protein n=1 Tax=Flavobacterium aurantiibacter TaxID=2023067 RepID=A0A255ZQ37_9FLAO|nr:DUF2809 domain-containing protein [Flavobacterium aurantiibacter]OYQ43512.1 hypothetical protein CHX27_09725 [Flavobacterium aurantiibacter]